MRKQAAIAVVIVVTFAYGFGVGRRHWWPASLLTTVKNLVESEDSQPVATFRNHSPKYRRLNSQDKALKNRQVVVIGDSRVEEGRWSDWLPAFAVSNRGIAGDTTFGVLERLDALVAAAPDALIVWVGVNDKSRGMTATDSHEAFMKVMQRVRAAGVPTIVLSITAVGPERGELQKRVVIQNAAILEYCEANNIPIVDTNEILDSQQRLPSQYSNDGIHLMGDAYDRICNSVSAELQTLLGDDRE